MKTTNNIMTIIGLTLCISAMFACAFACNASKNVAEKVDADVPTSEVVDAGTVDVDANTSDQ